MLPHATQLISELTLCVFSKFNNYMRKLTQVFISSTFEDSSICLDRFILRVFQSWKFQV